MITLDEILKFKEEIHRYACELAKTKGLDYCREQADTDTLFNLRVAALLGVVDTPMQGVLVRLSDKFMRLVSLTKTANRERAVEDETVRATLADLHNYGDYLVMLWEEARKSASCSSVPTESREVDNGS